MVKRGLLGTVLYRTFPNEPLREAVTERFPGGAVSLVGLRTSSRILEVGCGSGAFLLRLWETGFRTLEELDLYVEEHLEYPGELRVMNGSIGVCTGEWDIITFHYSFEHLPDPLESLKTAMGLLAGRGTIVVRMPP